MLVLVRMEEVIRAGKPPDWVGELATDQAPLQLNTFCSVTPCKRMCMFMRKGREVERRRGRGGPSGRAA